jgi:hypothetical protein
MTRTARLFGGSHAVGPDGVGTPKDRVRTLGRMSYIFEGIEAP